MVGIGASAGGLNAFTQLLKALPTDTGMAFVLVQHLDPKHVSLLPELMTRATAIPVAEVSDGMRVEPNHIYIMPPNHSLALLHGVLHLMPRPDMRGKHLPVDDFLQSLAQDRQSNAIGIILSGTASDGTLGMQAIKAAGGITFAQSEDSAEYGGMPHSAIAAGHVDFVLAPEEIARELARIARHPYLRQELLEVSQEAMAEGDKNMNKIFVLLRARTGIDFTYYKQNTIRRRIKRRMVLHQLDRMNDYVRFLQAHPKELDALMDVAAYQAYLESEGVHIGAVTAIVGIYRYLVTVEGEASHAGTTPMALRDDALVKAAPVFTLLPAWVRERNPEMVGTIGQVVLKLETAWRVDTAHLVMSPPEFMQRLAALEAEMHAAAEALDFEKAASRELELGPAAAELTTIEARLSGSLSRSSSSSRWRGFMSSGKYPIACAPASSGQSSSGS